MRKIVLSGAVLLGLLLIGSTSLAEVPGKIWWTEFTSDVFTFDSPGLYEYTYTWSSGGEISYAVQVAPEAQPYKGAALLRPWSVRARTDEPGLNCADLEAPIIQLGQPVRFQVFWTADSEMSRQQAEASFDAVSFTVLWGDETVSLERHGTYLDRGNIDWMNVSCRWTVRP